MESPLLSDLRAIERKIKKIEGGVVGPAKPGVYMIFM